MALDETQLGRLTEILEAAENASGRLSNWENSFVDDTRTRYEQYGASIKISSKQWDVLEKIYDRC